MKFISLAHIMAMALFSAEVVGSKKSLKKLTLAFHFDKACGENGEQLGMKRLYAKLA